MAGIDPKKQLLTLIRDFASEKSQGERRVIGLKKRIGELQLDLEAANAEREEAKRFKETTEQELKGYEVELALNNTTCQALESRISLVQDEISTVRSQLEILKREEGALRDGFISQMYELNNQIRTFQKSRAFKFQEENVESAAEAEHGFSKEEVTEVTLRTLEDSLADVVAQTSKEEKEYLEEENIKKQVQLELSDLERKVSLMEIIMEETKSLQNLTGQTSDLEQKCASLSEELQKRCMCPTCNKENVEALGCILQANRAG